MPSLQIDTEPNLNLTFPLPYRVLCLIGLGILSWATNLHGLHLSGIDAVAALELRTEGQISQAPLFANRSNGHGKHLSPSLLYLATYKVFFVYAAFCFTSWTVFRVCTRGDDLLVDAFGHIPLVTGLVILTILVCPMNILFKHERDRFLYALYRCIFSPFQAPIQFSDVVFADIVTSLAKVLGDVWLSIAMLLPGNTLLAAPSEDGWQRWVLPAIMSFPYLVRFRQCMIEYSLPQNSSQRPLYNAIKYASAFPVIFLSAAQKSAPELQFMTASSSLPNKPWPGTFRLWLIAAAINSTYSFWWDVTNDWGLELLKKQQETSDSGHRTPPRRLRLQSYSHTPLLTRTSFDSTTSDISSEEHRHSVTSSRATNRSHPWGLRSILLYPLPVYPLLVFLNLILRMTWSIKLSSHLYSVSNGSMGIFWLEVAEIVRRWLWVFLRVEWEVIKKLQDADLKARTDDFSTDNEYEMFPTTPENQLLLHP